MKRIDIIYGNEHYSVGGRTLESLTQEIAEGLASGHGWLQVNDGEGAPRVAYLLLTPGVNLSIVPIPDTATPDHDGSEPLADDPEADVARST
ncbi:hypothetical protein [Microbacterium sp. CFBP9034]|uniref:hypothetical protein n=1 Tax=Microbacterium sp. CFBP9034 TaxID=3096540 RepID=UPI002A69FF77|nr:hypothetical protein [Microbacterium sp. CFBP9034]MDY0911105.1 hypothetical protein [Microbacterium sp. CFBP9034]